ncbi:MAG: class II glutamine amidotransferase [Candidatus Sumerlaeota bacterium]
MCRFVLYMGEPITLANLITEPANSLINQSFHSRQQEEPLNGDGFGVAWYASKLSDKPAVFRSVTPAWNNLNLLNLARVTVSDCVLAHVRAATPGLPTTEQNCHPFIHGPFAFMHNGDLNGFHDVRRDLLSSLGAEAFELVHGNTDSEHVFALFIDELGKTAWGKNKIHTGAMMARSLERAISRALKLCTDHGFGSDATYLNIAISDGHCAVACRFTGAEEALSLYVHHGGQYQCEGGVCRMRSADQRDGAVIISSEPLSDEDGWEEVPPNHIVIVEADFHLMRRKLRLTSG